MASNHINPIEMVEIEGRRALLKSELGMLDQQIENVRMQIIELEFAINMSKAKDIKV